MKAQPLPAHVRQAGEDIASDLFNATIAKSMADLGGGTAKLPTNPDNQDLIDAHVANRLTSVEAIFIAMTRAAAEVSS